MKWEIKPLTDFIWFQRGFDLPKEKFINGEYPVVGSTSILGYHAEAKVKAPGIVTGRSGTIGQFQFLKIDFWPHNTSLWVKEFYGNDEKFAFYLLHTLDFISLNGGGAVPSLNRNFLSSISVKIPPLPTQRRIASILSAYDDLIENNLKRIKLLEEKAEIVFRTEFDFFKPSNEVNKLPEGWKVKRADEIYRINIGKTPPREQDEWFNDVDSGIKWVSIKDINNSTVYMLNTSETVTENAVNKFNMNVAKTDTVLLSFKLTVGKVAITTEEMVTNEAIAHFNIDDETSMNTEFIFFYLKNYPYDSLGSTSSIGTAINSKIVKAMPVLLPPKSVIQEFGKKVKPSFQMIKTLLKQNIKLREARDILLPKLMSGQIEV